MFVEFDVDVVACKLSEIDIRDYQQTYLIAQSVTDVHEGICTIILVTNNASCSGDPCLLPSSILEVLEFMMWMKD